MGNKHGCHFIPCVKQRHRRKDQPETATNPAMIPTPPIHEGESISLQHIQERDSEDLDPTIHPELPTMFIAKSELEEAHRQKRSNHHVEQRDHPHPIMRRRCSCSTIFVDDSTISQPNLRSTIKCVSLAVYYHIKNRITSREMDIFDEREHPLTKTPVPADYHLHNPEHRHIYKFIRMLFNAAQLTSECAIVTLVYLERLLINAEIDILPGNWKRIVLGAILLSSKVWDDQAVWNVDYCQILRDLTVEDMNEMERQFLQVLDFNINVPSSVYAKYYFDLRILSDAYELSLPSEPLYKERAKKLEAFSKESEARLNCAINTKSLRRVQSDTIVSMLPRFDAAILS